MRHSIPNMRRVRASRVLRVRVAYVSLHMLLGVL